MSTARVSMGSIGEVEWDQTNDRWKGLLIGLHSDIPSVLNTLSRLVDTCRGGSRLTVRIFLEGGADYDLISKIQMPWRDAMLVCEAMIPVEGSCVGAIMYFGANTLERRTSASVVGQEWNLVHRLSTSPKKTRTTLPPGFIVEVLPSHPTDRDIARLLEIYKASFSTYLTEFDPQSLRAMLRENITTVVRNEKQEIVAVNQAEIASLDIEGEPLNLVEISETAVDPAYRGHGLTYFCRESVLTQLPSEHTLIYAESRANHAAILKINFGIGMKVAGRLDKQCIMDSVASEIPQEGPYANLFVFYCQRQ